MSALPDDTQQVDLGPAADPEPLAAEIFGEPSGSILERSDVVWTLAWFAVLLGVVGLIATARLWSASSAANLAQPPRFRTDVNTAPAAELALLPGIGPGLAARIVAERESAGPFAAAHELTRVHGIGPKTINDIAPLVICSSSSIPESLPP